MTVLPLIAASRRACASVRRRAPPQSGRTGGPPGPPRPLGLAALDGSTGALRTTLVIRTAIGRRRRSSATRTTATRAHHRHRRRAPATAIARASRRRRGWVRRPTPTAPSARRSPSYGQLAGSRCPPALTDLSATSPSSPGPGTPSDTRRGHPRSPRSRAPAPRRASCGSSASRAGSFRTRPPHSRT